MAVKLICLYKEVIKYDFIFEQNHQALGVYIEFSLLKARSRPFPILMFFLQAQELSCFKEKQFILEKSTPEI